ncbi:unnamed protein product [Agarophyton chilense]
MEKQIQKALREEQRAFEAIEKRGSPADCIVTISLEFDAHSNMLCQFATADNTQYALCVVLDKPAHLSWKESRALVDVMELAQRGASINEESFQQFTHRLRETYGRVEGPKRMVGVNCAACFPGPSKVAVRDPNTIISTAMSFDDEEQTLAFKSETSYGSTYHISINLQLTDHQLTKLDCQAVVHTLRMLEMGDVLYPTRFFALGLKLRQHYNFVEAEETTAANEYTLRITPTSARNTAAIQGVLIRAAISYGSSFALPDSNCRDETGSSSEQDFYSSLSSPYRGVTFTRCLKQSGQAQVFIGVKDGVQVAIKVFLDGEQQDAFFKNELKLLLKMTDHPNVVQVYDFFSSPKPAIVMEYVEGEDLMDYLASNPKLSEAEGKKVVLGIAEGLYHLHKNKVIHRDLKTPNIMRRTGGVPVIIDLGLSALLNRASNIPSQVRQSSEIDVSSRVEQLATAASTTYLRNETKTGKGSLLWITPEMILENEWSERSDVYAFGIIMWEVFSGKMPFISDIPNAHELNRRELEMKILQDIVDGVRPSMSHVSHIAPYLQETMQLCWHPDPVCRPTMLRVRDVLLGNDPEQLFQSCDIDRSGYLQFGEFAQFMDKYTHGAFGPEEVLFVFNYIDTDKDRRISFAEFENSWSFLQQYGLSSFIANKNKTVFDEA